VVSFLYVSPPKSYMHFPFFPYPTSCPSYRDRHVVRALLGRGILVIHHAPHYTVKVSEHSKNRNVPLKHFSLWCMCKDRRVQGTRFVTMQ
jgi:hypothetical protein